MHGGACESDTTGDLHQQIARLGQRGPDAAGWWGQLDAARFVRGPMWGASRAVSGGNAMSWRKLAAGSASTGGVIADVSGAMENTIALCALLNPSLPDESMWVVFWDIDDGVDDRTAVTALAESADEAWLRYDAQKREATNRGARTIAIRITPALEVLRKR
jgi:hypothetical protein